MLVLACIKNKMELVHNFVFKKYQIYDRRINPTLNRTYVNLFIEMHFCTILNRRSIIEYFVTARLLH
jgi:hypothetical protein